MLDHNNVVIVSYTVFAIVVDLMCIAAALTVILCDHAPWSLLFVAIVVLCSSLWFRIGWTKRGE